MRRVWCALLALILCAGCAAQMASGATAAQQGVITLATAQQTDAPALALTDSGIVAAWIGSDERGVHQDARRLSFGGEPGEVVTLPLPPIHPYAQQLIPGVSRTHLLWLDAGQDNQPQLYAALLAPNLTVERGPVVVSEGLALDYSAVPDGAGGLWAAWSGGMLGEPSLYVRRIDDAGRPLVDTTTIATGAEHPALVQTSGGEVWLFWLSNGQVMRQRLDPADNTKAQALTGAVSLALGDQIVSVSAALDRSSAYYFWNIRRVGGTHETWLTSGLLAAPYWRQPQRLHITTGELELTLRRVVPLAGQADTLVAAAESDAGLSVIQLSDGALVGYRTVAPGLRLIGLPALAAAPDAATLYMAWAAPGETSAALQVMTVPR